MHGHAAAVRLPPRRRLASRSRNYSPASARDAIGLLPDIIKYRPDWLDFLLLLRAVCLGALSHRVGVARCARPTQRDEF